MSSFKRLFLKRIIFWSLSLVFACYFLIAAFVNTKGLPYGTHLLIASGMAPLTGKEIFFLSKSVSRQLLKWQNLQCKFQVYKPNSGSVDNYPAFDAIPFLLNAHMDFQGNMSQEDNLYFNSIFSKFIKNCNREALQNSDSLPPIIYAVISKRVDFVESMVNEGVNLKLKISRPGRPADGKNTIEYVDYLIDKEANQNDKETYLKIASILKTAYAKQIN